VDEGEDSRTASLLVTTTRPMLSEKTARMGDKAKPLAAYRPTALLFSESVRNISIAGVPSTPAT
jgi:hypothetical protein